MLKVSVKAKNTKRMQRNTPTIRIDAKERGEGCPLRSRCTSQRLRIKCKKKTIYYKEERVSPKTWDSVFSYVFFFTFSVYLFIYRARRVPAHFHNFQCVSRDFCALLCFWAFWCTLVCVAPLRFLCIFTGFGAFGAWLRILPFGVSSAFSTLGRVGMFYVLLCFSRVPTFLRSRLRGRTRDQKIQQINIWRACIVSARIPFAGFGRRRLSPSVSLAFGRTVLRSDRT